MPGVRRDRSRTPRISTVQKDSGGRMQQPRGLERRALGSLAPRLRTGFWAESRAIPEWAFSVNPHLSVPQFGVEKNFCLLSHP